jgi:hypothetical protein
MDPRKMTDTDGDIDVTAALAALDDEEIGDETIEAITDLDEELIEDETTLGSSDEISDEDEALVESEVVKAEHYAETVGATTVAAESKPSKSARESKAKVTRDIVDLDPKHFVLTMDEPADLAANKLAVIGRRPAQVKVAEKFDNVLLSLAVEKKPSVYTMKAFEALAAAKTITSADMVKALTGSGVGVSTARSQAGQMMALFPALMIATRDGKNLKLNEDSLIAEALKLLAAAP